MQCEYFIGKRAGKSRGACKKMMVPFIAYSFNTLNRNLTKHLKQVYIAVYQSIVVNHS